MMTVLLGPARQRQIAAAVFLVLDDGGIYFEGTAAALRTSQDSYLRESLNKTMPPW
jgi:hypothetical protein